MTACSPTSTPMKENLKLHSDSNQVPINNSDSNQVPINKERDQNLAYALKCYHPNLTLLKVIFRKRKELTILYEITTI